MIDLNTCKKGDQLLSRQGLILTYHKKLPEGFFYDHEVIYPNGSVGTRTNDGYVYRNLDKRLPQDHDIIKILSSKDKSYIREEVERIELNAVDALGHKIVKNRLYGYSFNKSGLSYTKIGRAQSITKSGKCVLELEISKCKKFLYGKETDPFQYEFQNKVTINSFMLFPVESD